MAREEKAEGSGSRSAAGPRDREPRIDVGIVEGAGSVAGRLHGDFDAGGAGRVSGAVRAEASSGAVVLTDGRGGEIARGPHLSLASRAGSTFTLFNVTIGKSFHWERAEDQTFPGDMVLLPGPDGRLVVINRIGVEDYLKSVISSEMSGGAPEEFLKAHAILSRSWLLSALDRKRGARRASPAVSVASGEKGEIIRWYEQEDHDLFDVCADDHCQRYQGMTKIVSGSAGRCVADTRGKVIMYGDEVCDARYSKACGGLTEDFGTAWEDRRVPYLVSISDASLSYPPIRTEEEAGQWILSEPDAYCNAKDASILEKILPDFDQETKGFFRWKVEYSRGELEEIVREKSGIDFGTLQEIKPLERGPSGRVRRLRIRGSRRSVTVGKELEIRRWLSRSHLYSSAFIVVAAPGPSGKIARFTFYGAGWGHGVGLCQIGAAVMASRGFSAESILSHYFPGTEIREIY